MYVKFNYIKIKDKYKFHIVEVIRGINSFGYSPISLSDSIKNEYNELTERSNEEDFIKTYLSFGREDWEVNFEKQNCAICNFD